MAPSSSRSRHTVEQRLASLFVKRGPLLRRDTASILPTDAAIPSPSFESTNTPSATSSSPSSSSSPSGPPGVTLPPHSVAVLISIIVVLSVAILGVSAWRVWVYRRNKIARKAPSEKCSKHVGLYDAVDEDQKYMGSLSMADANAITFPPKIGSKAAMARERTAAEVKVNLGYRPDVVYAVFEETRAPSPGNKPTLPPLGLQITPPPVYLSIPPPVVSPRTAASITPTGKTVPRAAFKRPRLVVVVSTYPSTLDDELKVRVGETLQLLEEYEDEWCLVQRVDSETAEKGVVPRFCVVDQQKLAS